MNWIDAAEVAIRSEGSPRAIWLRERVHGKTRHVWSLFSNLDADSRVLVLGEEWGASVIGLLNITKEVTAVPASEESSAILESRLASHHLDTVTVLAPEVSYPLPFGDEYFDAVLIPAPIDEFLAGVNGSGYTSRRLFEEINRILKGSGCLHFTTNRVRVGTRDSRLVRAVAYARGLGSMARAFNSMRLLRSCGFKSSHFYGASSEYGFSGKLRLLNYDGRHFLAGIALALRAELKYPSGLHLVWKRKGVRRSVDDLAAGLNAHAEFPSKMTVSGTGMMVAELKAPRGHGSDTGMVRVSFSQFGAKRVRNNALRLEQLGDLLQSVDPLPAEIPRVISSGELGGRAYSFETTLPGSSTSSLGVRRDELPGVHRQATEFLVSLHRAAAHPTRMDEQNLAQLFIDPVDRLLRFARTDGERDKLESIASYFRHVCGNRTIPLVFIHGDFWVGNLLLDPETFDLRSVIDWDMSIDRGLPLLDLLTMLLLSARHYADGKRPYRRLFDFDWGPSGDEMVDRYCTALDIDTEIRLALAISTWTFELGSLQRRRLVVPQSWLDAKLYQPLDLAASRVAAMTRGDH